MPKRTFISSSLRNRRLLSGIRYTHESNLSSDAQEALKNTVDINVGEVYAESHQIPTSSVFKGYNTSGHAEEVQRFVTGSDGQNILEYVIKAPLVQSSVDKSTWFVMNRGFNISSITNINPGIEHAEQVNNIISPKYGGTPTQTAGASSAATQSHAFGYAVSLYYKNTDASASATWINPAAIPTSIGITDYVFDYKNGTLLFDDEPNGTANFFYATFYKYVGKTLNDTGSIPAHKIDGTLSQWTASSGNTIHRGSDVDITGSLLVTNTYKTGSGGVGLNFNGHLTASGHISSSGTIYADSLQIGGSTSGAGISGTSISASGGITGSSINRETLMNSFVFGATASFDANVSASSGHPGIGTIGSGLDAGHTYYMISSSVRAQSEMVFVNGLLQDSGSDNDYLMYPSGSYTQLQFTYKVPKNSSKIKITYIPNTPNDQ